ARGLAADDGELVFGTLLRVNLGHADLFREIAHFRRAIAGDDHDAVEMVRRSEVRHERAAVIARRIAELQQRRRAIVNDDCALESVSKRRKLLSAGDLFLERATSTGNGDTMPRDDASQT